MQFVDGGDQGLLAGGQRLVQRLAYLFADLGLHDVGVRGVAPLEMAFDVLTLIVAVDHDQTEGLIAVAPDGGDHGQAAPHGRPENEQLGGILGHAPDGLLHGPQNLERIALRQRLAQMTFDHLRATNEQDFRLGHRALLSARRGGLQGLAGGECPAIGHRGSRAPPGPCVPQGA